MTLRKAVALTVCALALAGLAGCASGPMPGRLILPDRAPQPIALKYESSVFGGSGKLSTQMPDGERFAGTYVLMPYAADHHIVCTLDGDRGGSMVCRFKLNEPGVGPDRGGVGNCQLSQGGFIDVRF